MPEATQRQGGSSPQGWLCPGASGGLAGSPALWVMLSRALTFSGLDPMSTLPRAVWVQGGAGSGCSSRLNWPSVPKGAGGLALGVAWAGDRPPPGPPLQRLGGGGGWLPESVELHPHPRPPVTR